MRKLILLAVLLIAVAGCGTGSKSSAKAGRPEVRITQLTVMPVAARHTTGGMPVQYRVRLRNNGTTPLTLERVTIVSVGSGAYEVSHTAPIDLTVEPEQSREKDFWAPTELSESVAGANGPVTLRVVAYLKNASGTFEDVTVQNVNAMGMPR